MRKLLLSLSLMCCVSAAGAEQYTQVLPERSEIHFQYKQMGVDMKGKFPKFSGELSFDPAQPEQGRVAIEVSLAGVDTGSDEADEELGGAEWFNTKKHPTASFESSAIQVSGDDGYLVHGLLLIKGQNRPVTVPAKFSEKDGMGFFEGRFTILRGDFGVGEGGWAAFDIVANEIQVEFRIAAQP